MTVQTEKSRRGRRPDNNFIRRTTAYAQRIRDLREDHDMSQTQIAEMLHVGQRTYSDYETGRIRIPVDCLITLAEFYDIDMNYICGLTKTRRPFPGNTAS